MSFRYLSRPHGDSSIFVSHIGYETDPKFTWWDAPNGYHVIHYVLSGEGFLNGKLIKEGQGFYLSKEAERKYYPNPLNPWSYFWFSFDGDFVETLLSLINIPQKTYIFDMPSFYELKNFVLNLDSQHPLFDNERVSTYISQSLAKSYFYKVISLHDTASDPIENIVPSHVLKAEQYMMENYNKNIKISDVANHLNIDARYLYKLFTKHFNTSPKQYLINLRITHAIELLSKPDLSIKHIAFMCGYADSLQFSNFFKKNVGISPSEFRKNRYKL